MHAAGQPMRRDLLRGLAAAACAAALGAGCEKTGASAGRLELVWGDRGNRPGHLQKPRAIAADANDRLYVADMTDRIQVFSADGDFLDYWRLPAFDVDGPTGLAIDADGNLLVADTHFYRVLVYSPSGRELARIGGTPGSEPGQFGYVRDVARHPDGRIYTCESGDQDRVQILSPHGAYLGQFGVKGHEPGEFYRPEALVFDAQARLFVCDSCNHRVQVFSDAGELMDIWGEPGSELGQLRYPYDLTLTPDGSVCVCEWGNNRIQKFTPAGRSLGAWGRPGRAPGELNYPWGLAADRHGRIHVADSSNHRVQRIVL
jgi:DNA-binding beta-propeller fold protein YncE